MTRPPAATQQLRAAALVDDHVVQTASGQTKGMQMQKAR